VSAWGVGKKSLKQTYFQRFLNFPISKLLQVRDYRKCVSEQGSSIPPRDGIPVVNRVRLRMSLENVVKDIPLISDHSWTYGDFMASVI